MSNDTNIINAKNITKFFGSVVALDNVDFELKNGEILGLVGDNGAGKSTLIKILSGAELPNEGSIEVFGEQAHIKNPRDAFELGIETIYQDLALFDNLNFTENIFAGREFSSSGLGWVFGFIDGKRMQRDASDRVKNISINLPRLNQKVKQLSGGQRQAIAIIRALFWGQKIIIMDEPTAALGVREAAKVLELIEETRKHVNGLIIITHNIEHIIKIADRVLVLRNGRRVGDITFKDYGTRLDDLHNDIVKLITGAEIIDYKA